MMSSTFLQVRAAPTTNSGRSECSAASTSSLVISGEVPESLMFGEETAVGLDGSKPLPNRKSTGAPPAGYMWLAVGSMAK